MTKKRKLEIEVVAVAVLYGVLVVMVIIGHNILDKIVFMSKKKE